MNKHRIYNQKAMTGQNNQNNKAETQEKKKKKKKPPALIWRPCTPKNLQEN